MRAGVGAGATRVLVTHQRQFLPACDRLLVLRGGRVVAAGTFQQLQSLQLSELHIPSGALRLASAFPAPSHQSFLFPPPLFGAPIIIECVFSHSLNLPSSLHLAPGLHIPAGAHCLPSTSSLASTSRRSSSLHPPPFVAAVTAHVHVL